MYCDSLWIQRSRCNDRRAMDMTDEKAKAEDVLCLSHYIAVQKRQTKCMYRLCKNRFKRCKEWYPPGLDPQSQKHSGICKRRPGVYGLGDKRWAGIFERVSPCWLEGAGLWGVADGALFWACQLRWLTLLVCLVHPAAPVGGEYRKERHNCNKVVQHVLTLLVALVQYHHRTEVVFIFSKTADYVHLQAISGDFLHLLIV